MDNSTQTQSVQGKVGTRMQAPTPIADRPVQEVSNTPKESLVDKPTVPASVHPEHDPISVDAKVEKQKIVEESKSEAVISPEVSEFVKPGPDSLSNSLPEDIEELGVVLTDENAPMELAIIDDQQKPDLPMSFEDATIAQKKSKIRSGLRWLATLILEQWKVFNFSVKERKVEE